MDSYCIQWLLALGVALARRRQRHPLRRPRRGQLPARAAVLTDTCSSSTRPTDRPNPSLRYPAGFVQYEGGPALSESGCAAALRARVTMLERKPSLPFLDSMSYCMGILACPSVSWYCDLAWFPLPPDSLQSPQNILLARQSGPGPCGYPFVCHYEQCKQKPTEGRLNENTP